jgi:ankyrin repeat protein
MAMKIIVLLMKNGADLNARIDGVTAMDYAQESQNLDLVMFLKSLGVAQ